MDTLATPNIQIVPLPGESQEHFIVRAHRALSETVTDPHERNEIVWDAWHQARGLTDEERLASDAFDAEKYELNRNQCVFSEHETVDNGGRPRKYDLRKLAKIVRDGNERIADVGAFAALSDSHTPNPKDNRPSPVILGYAGPYRLGMIGHRKPRWAIFADEWHLRSAKPVLAGKPRRSVELWNFKSTGKSFFDPVAAIGSDAPRLPLPQKFTLHHETGATCERYTVAAPAYPGGMNTSTKKFTQGAANMALDQTDLAQIMSALQQILPQAIDEYLASKQPAKPSPNADQDDAGGADDTADLDDLIDQEDQDDDDQSATPTPQKPPQKMTMPSQYSANSVATPEKYQALQGAHNRLVQDFGRMTTRLQQLERESTDAKRTLRLQELAQSHEGVVDLQDELQLTLYSNGANMTDAEFEKHVATVEKYAQRSAPAARMIPVGEMPSRQDAQAEKYQAELSAEAVRLHTAAINAGKTGMTWDEALEAAKTKLKR